jgi:DNA-binding CsgD family transcriptional regulator
MAGLMARDLRAIHRFLDDAYVQAEAAPPDPVHGFGTLPRPVLQGIERLIGADLVESFQIRRGVFAEAPLTTDRDEDEPPPEFAAHVRSPLWGVNPINAFTRHPADGPLRLSGVMSPRRLKELPWHRHYLRPRGIHDQLKVWLWSSPEAAACVGLDRYESDFADRDVAVLAVIQQHLAAIRESIMSARPTDADPAREPLTVREAQVLSWVARGRSNREIAEILFISPATVRKHLEHAYEKLGVRSRGEAVAALRARPGD